MRNRSVSVFMVVSLLLAACAQHKATEKEIDTGIAQADKAAKDHAVVKTVTPSRVTYSDVPIIGTQAMVNHEFTLPAALAGKTIVLEGDYTLQQVKGKLEAKGIPTIIGDQLELRAVTTPAATTQTGTGAQARTQSSGNGVGAQSVVGSQGVAASPEAEMLAALGVQGSGGGMASGGLQDRLLPTYATINYVGNAEGLIRKIEPAFGVVASVIDGVVHLDYYQTRIFHVNAPSGSAKQTTGFGGGSGGSDTNGSATGTTTPVASTTSGASGTGSSTSSAGSTTVTGTTNVDIWPEIDAQLKEMLPTRARYKVSSGLGTVLVVASPSTMRQVERYFDRLNADLDPRIAVDVTVIKVSLTDTANYDFDLNLLFQQAAAVGGAAWSLGGIAPSVLTSTGTAGVQIVNASSQFNTSQAVLHAVSTIGRVVDYKSGSLTTQNNRPAMVNLITDQDVIKSIQLNVYGNNSGVSNTTVTPSTLEYGYTLTVWPRVVGHNRISVNISSLDSDLADLATVTVSSNQLQEATITHGTNNNEVTLGLNETLVLSGFTQTSASRKKSGMGSADNMAFGGTNDASLTKTRVIMIVHPKLLRSPDAGFDRKGAGS